MNLHLICEDCFRLMAKSDYCYEQKEQMIEYWKKILKEGKHSPDVLRCV